MSKLPPRLEPAALRDFFAQPLADLIGLVAELRADDPDFTAGTVDAVSDLMPGDDIDTWNALQDAVYGL